MIKPLLGDNHDDGDTDDYEDEDDADDPDDGDDYENEDDDDDDDQEGGCIETAKARYNQTSSSCASIKDGAGL